MRIVLDTNVLISALVASGTAPAQILARCQAGELELLVSPASLAELRRVLTYPRIRTRLRYTDAQIARVLAYLQHAAIVVTPTVVDHVVLDDADDDQFIALALAGEARYLVSGDDHLLRLGQHQGITILKPAAFLRIWQTLHPE
jgi:putative PIN family toxin of toxin-antitoxin system